MSNIAAIELSNLLAVRRLMDIEKIVKLRRSGQYVQEKSALDYFEEDQAYISDSALTAQKQGSNPLPPVENMNIKLSDLHKKEGNNGIADSARENAVDEEFTITGSQSVEVRLEMRYQSNTPLEGLLVHDQNDAESDRYLFKFADGATFTILDKWTNKSTTIWGDPHVDVDDVAGNNNGDFKDLTVSDNFTTFMLGDGTRVTFKAKDDGIIEQVDIFKGLQHIKGIGSAAQKFSPEAGLFSRIVQVDGMIASNKHPLGDVVYAGGDGNDWFDAGQKMVWGKTTGMVVTQRPSVHLKFYHKQNVSQSITIDAIVKNA